MDLDTRLLRYFAVVAEEGNLTRAAERLFVSQPALTKQIRQLEGHLGVRLFDRSRAGMTLTAAGQALADRVPAILAGLDQALQGAKYAASNAARAAGAKSGLNSTSWVMPTTPQAWMTRTATRACSGVKRDRSASARMVAKDCA